MDSELCKSKTARKSEMVGRDSVQAPFNRLPDECILEIFSYNSDPVDRLSCAAVCKKWLILQAHLRRSDFKLEPLSPSNARARFTRCLEGCNAVDTRLAAMVVSKFFRGRISSLSIRGDYSLESTLSTPYTNGVTDYGLYIVGSSFPYLKSLALWGCLHVTCRGLAYMGQGCSLLEKLDLCECPLLTDDGMTHVASKLRNLITLSIDACQNIGNGTLKAFGSYTPTLESLSIMGCPLVGDEGIRDIVDGFPNLKRLKLARVSSNISVVLHNVRRVKGLASLSLEELPSDIKDKKSDSWEHLYHKSFGMACPNLKSISMSKCSLFDDNSLLMLGKGGLQLENLTIESCNQVSLHGLVEFLSRYGENLKVLTLEKCKGIREPRNWFIPQSPPCCNTLESLRVRQCRGIGDGFFTWLGNVCWRLDEVELTALGGISDQGFLGLVMGSREGTPRLENVLLSECPGLTDVSVFCIASVFGEKLKSLGLGACSGMSSKSLEIIASCCPKLLDLELTEFEITDDELVYLHNVNGLLRLNLKKCFSLR